MRHGERVDAVARHPGGVGVDRLGRQLDALGVQRAPACVATCTARRAVSAATSGRQLGVRGEAPGAVDDHPDGQADLAVDDRGLQLAVAQLDDLV